MMKETDKITYMRRALELAKQGLYTTGSNPRVGCVIVHNGKVVGEGWHQRDGEKHAEAIALSQASEASAGATALVTLEPCCHTGKQPPCTKAIIDAGIAKVIVAAKDPNPRVAGKGIQQLEKAGITVESGLLAEESQALNIGFHKRMTTGYPWLRLKIALSLDGKIAAADGSSQWITGSQARADTMHWRARAQAIITARGTVAADNPRMTARNLEQDVQQPHPIILDSRLRLPTDASVLQKEATLISCLTADEKKYHPLVKHVTCTEKDGHVDLKQLHKWLATREYNEVHVEAGAQLSGALLQQGLVDELLVYQAPVLLGHKGISAFVLPINSINEKYSLQLIEQLKVGNDHRFRYLPK